MTRAAFRGAWRAGRRCLVLADGYYEWRNADKQPFAIALANRGPMTLAEVYQLCQCNGLRCQSATSRVFDDKGVFLKVSN